MSPRACYLPVYDAATSKMRLKKAVFMAGGVHGDFEDFPGNVSSTDADIKTVGTANSKGGDSTTNAAKADHVHKDRFPGNSASKTTLSFTPPATASVAQAGTWASGGATGLVFRMATRTIYDTTSTPVFRCFYRDCTFDEYGRLYSVGAEYVYTFASPEMDI